MNQPKPSNIAAGSARYFLPVCIKHPGGFIGGPFQYREVSEQEARECGTIVVDPMTGTEERWPNRRGMK